MVDIVIEAGVKLSEISLKTMDIDSEEPEVKIISSGYELKSIEIFFLIVSNSVAQSIPNLYVEETLPQ